jgi:hypothetical protein
MPPIVFQVTTSHSSIIQLSTLSEERPGDAWQHCNPLAFPLEENYLSLCHFMDLSPPDPSLHQVKGLCFIFSSSGHQSVRVS